MNKDANAVRRNQLVKALASKAGSIQAEASKFIETFVATVSETLAKKEEINLIGGFESFILPIVKQVKVKTQKPLKL